MYSLKDTDRLDVRAALCSIAPPPYAHHCAHHFHLPAPYAQVPPRVPTAALLLLRRAAMPHLLPSIYRYASPTSITQAFYQRCTLGSDMRLLVGTEQIYRPLQCCCMPACRTCRACFGTFSCCHCTARLLLRARRSPPPPPLPLFTGADSNRTRANILPPLARLNTPPLQPTSTNSGWFVRRGYLL